MIGGHGLAAARAHTAPNTTGVPLAETREQIVGALRLLLDAGAADGTLRADVDPKDVMRVMNGIWYLPDGPEWRDSVGKMLHLVIDGLRYGVPNRMR